MPHKSNLYFIKFVKIISIIASFFVATNSSVSAETLKFKDMHTRGYKLCLYPLLSTSVLFYRFVSDKKNNQLYMCATGKKFDICEVINASKNKDINEVHPITAKHRIIAKTRGWKYLRLLSISDSYFLQGKEPFKQWNRFSFYQTKANYMACRETVWDYNFTYNENGKYLVFKSKKGNETEFSCEPMKC